MVYVQLLSVEEKPGKFARELCVCILDITRQCENTSSSSESEQSDDYQINVQRRARRRLSQQGRCGGCHDRLH